MRGLAEPQCCTSFEASSYGDPSNQPSLNTDPSGSSSTSEMANISHRSSEAAASRTPIIVPLG